MGIKLDVVKNALTKKGQKPTPEPEEDEEEESEEEEETEDEGDMEEEDESDEEDEKPQKPKKTEPTAPAPPNPQADYLSRVMYNTAELGVSVCDVDVVKNKAVPGVYTIVLLDSLSLPKAKVPMSKTVAKKLITLLKKNFDEEEA